MDLKVRALEEENAKLKDHLKKTVALVGDLVKYRQFVLLNCKCDSREKQLLTAKDPVKRVDISNRSENLKEEGAGNKEKSDGKGSESNLLDNYENQSSDEVMIIEDSGKEANSGNKPEENRSIEEVTNNKANGGVMVPHPMLGYIILLPKRDQESRSGNNNEKSTEGLLRNEAKPIVEKKCYKCKWPGCDYQNKNRYNVVNHALRHGKPTFDCSWPGCSRMFYRNSEVKTHVEIFHKQIKRFKCDWPGCDYRTWDKSSLDKHFGYHTRERKWACTWPGCDKKYMSKSNRDGHMEVHQPREFKCSVEGCGKVYSLSSSFNHHKLVHKRTRKFKCPAAGCDKELATEKYLKSHIRLVHESIEKKFKCEWPGCEFKGKRKINVDHHAKRHGNPSIACHWPGCELMFHFQSEMKNHVKVIHEQEKRFKCDWPSCEFRTSANAKLKTHFGFHTRERKWACTWPGCDKKYMCRSNRDRHENEQHKDRSRISSTTSIKKRVETSEKCSPAETLGKRVKTSHEKEKLKK